MAALFQEWGGVGKHWSRGRAPQSRAAGRGGHLPFLFHKMSAFFPCFILATSTAGWERLNVCVTFSGTRLAAGSDRNRDWVRKQDLQYFLFPDHQRVMLWIAQICHSIFVWDFQNSPKHFILLNMYICLFYSIYLMESVYHLIRRGTPNGLVEIKNTLKLLIEVRFEANLILKIIINIIIIYYNK